MKKEQKICFLNTFKPVLLVGVFAIFYLILGQGASVDAQVGPPLVGKCFAEPSFAAVGESVTWNADISGGGGPNTYFYLWSGTDNLKGYSASSRKTYKTPGLKTATVRVSSGNQQVYRSCSVNITNTGASSQPSAQQQNQTANVSSALNTENEQSLAGQNHNQFLGSKDLFVYCFANPSRVGVGQQAVWTAVAGGGAGLYQYSWEGTDGLSGNIESFIKTYDTTGVKTAEVEVESGGESVTSSCSLEVADGGVVAGAFTEQVLGSGQVSDSFFKIFLVIIMITWSVLLFVIFLFFKRKTEKQTEKSSLAYASHSHFTPGADDGSSKDISETVQEEVRKNDMIISADGLKTLIEKSNYDVKSALDNLNSILEFKKGLPCPIIDGEERCDVLTKSKIDKFFQKKEGGENVDY